MWIIDPLDGTREFAMQGRDDWAVHVALWEAGAGSPRPPWPCPPPGGVCHRAAPPAGPAEGVHVGPADRGQRQPAAGVRAVVAAVVGAAVTPLGSAGAKTMAVVRGDADAYLHAGGQWEWDSAAPVGVALAADCTRLASTAARCGTTSLTPTCPTCSSVSRPAGPLLAALEPYRDR